MVTVKFFQKDEVADEKLKFSVIVSRYQGKWIFSRHKKRSTWEIPGGHRENGECTFETAKRELYEETGATEFELKEVCVYGVEKDGEITYGMLHFAEVTKLGPLPPEMEIGEIELFFYLPTSLTYPEIQPELFRYVQAWLNLQTNPNELWDIYDENRQITGRKHRRCEPMKKGEYHLIVNVWLQNPRGEYLLTKRTPNKGFPNMWECTGGAVLAGETSHAAAMRELREETGICVSPENGRCILSLKKRSYITDVWLFKQDFDVQKVVYQPNETCGAMVASKETILKMDSDGVLMPIPYLKDFLENECGGMKES